MDNNTNRSENISLIVIIIVIVVLISAAFAWFFTYKKSKNKKNQPKVVKTDVSKLKSKDLDLKPVVKEKTQFEKDKEQFDTFFPLSIFKNYLDNNKGDLNINYFKRAVRYGFQGDYLADLPDASWENLEKTKREAIGLARKLFSNPEFLKSFYLKLKPLILEIKMNSKSRKNTIFFLKKAKKYFAEDLKGKTKSLFQAHYSTDSKLYNEIQKRKYNKEAISQLTNKSDSYLKRLNARGYRDSDIYLYQFAQRRKVEGGKDILDVYVFILNDLINEFDSLKN